MNSRYNLAGSGICNLFHLRFWHTAAGENPCLCKVVLRNIIYSFLAEYGACTRSNYGVRHSAKESLFRCNETLQLLRCRHRYFRLCFRIAQLKGKINKEDTGVCNARRHFRICTLFLHCDSLNKFALRNALALYFFNFYIPYIDFAPGCNMLDSINNKVRQHLFISLGPLSRHCSHCNVPQNILVFKRQSLLPQDLKSFGGSQAVSFSNHSRMNLFVEQSFCIFQQFSSKQRGRSCAIANFTFLCLCNLYHHARRGMVKFHLLQNCYAVICNNDISSAVDRHLVHAFWPKGRFNNICNNSRCKNVSALCVLSKCA